MLASLQRQLCLCLAWCALQSQHDLLRCLCLLVENGLCLTTITGLFTIITTLSLREEGGLGEIRVRGFSSWIGREFQVPFLPCTGWPCAVCAFCSPCPCSRYVWSWVRWPVRGMMLAFIQTLVCIPSSRSGASAILHQPAWAHSKARLVVSYHLRFADRCWEFRGRGWWFDGEICRAPPISMPLIPFQSIFDRDNPASPLPDNLQKK